MSNMIVPAPQNQKQTTEIVLNPGVGSLVMSLLNLPENIQVFSNTYETSGLALERMLLKGCKVSAVSTLPEIPRRANLSVTQGDSLAYFQPKDQFHMAFGCYPFAVDPYTEDERLQVSPVPMQDRLEIFRCADGKRDRYATAHMIGLEALLKSVFLGGYFAAVLPKRWVGREMKYMRWWQENAATVARINLPESAVACRIYRDGEPIELVAPGKWSLWVWQRPLMQSEDNVQSLKYRKMIQWATFRYAPFIFPLETLDSNAISTCVKAFGYSDWYHQGVKLYRRLLEAHVFHAHFGTAVERPHGLPEQKDVWFFENPNKDQDGILVVDKIDDAFKKKNRKIIHIKPGSSRTKLAAYNLQSKSALLDVLASRGVKHGEGGRLEYELGEILSRKPYSEIRNALAMTIRDYGMTPVLTRADYLRMRRQEIWLDRQLTPIERTINVRGVGGDTQNEQQENWEILYEDSGMHATFPEVMSQWYARATKMGLNKILYKFQFKDICVMAAKQSVLCGNHMGLGKTRTALAACLLRGSEKILIVVPSKLIGEWQDEIQNCIIPYARRQRRDWRGKVLNVDFQVIENAEHCLPHNLKRFNIISYDKLKSIPRDGRFFKCPKCGTVVYSPRATTPQFCPGLMYKGQRSTDQPLNTCNNRIKAWRASNKARGLRKHLLDVSTGKIYDYYRDWKERYARCQQPDPVTGKCKLDPNIDIYSWQVVDPRPPKPEMELMEMQVNMFKKQQPAILRYETNEHTGEKKPIIRNIDRPSHVAWTFSDLLRWTFNYIIVDEAYFVKNEEALRSQAVVHLNAEHKAPMTGTLIKGYPQSILNIENWAFKRSVLPDYRTYEGGEARFLAKYGTEVKIGGVQMANGEVHGGKSKQVPKINNPELFQAEMAPVLLRHTRNEPEVRADIPRKIVVQTELEVEMDPKHRAYYERWLEVFAEWWQKMKEEEEGRSVNQGDLLTKITYLINASTVPHYMLENILKTKDEQGKQWMTMIGKYKGPATRKMLECWRLIREATKVGDKTIVFSTRRKNLTTGQSWCEKKGFYGMIVDGSVSNKIEPDGRSKRHKMVQDFRSLDYHVLWAGLGALAEGMNIPEANRGILMDCSWDPAEARQAIGRMIRPAQQKTIYSTFLMHKGTIDGYMAALCYLKGRSSDEGLDYMEFGDFSTELIPDIKQYADAIVDGTQEQMKQKMWLAVEHIRNMAREGEEEERVDDGEE